MGAGNVDSGNSWLPQCWHLRSSSVACNFSGINFVYFTLKVIFPSPGHSFCVCVFGNKAQLDDTLPKFHFDILIVPANNTLALQVREENISVFVSQQLPPGMGYVRGLELLLLFQQLPTEERSKANNFRRVGTPGSF